MNRPIMRLAAGALGTFAVLTVVAGLVLAASAGRGTASADTGWVIPLAAGGFAGLFSWFLLTGKAGGERREAKRPTVNCALCGSEVFEEWRLCPFCGGSSEQPPTTTEGSCISSQVEG